MTRKLNCWEFKNCGREKDGLMVPILGECPVPHMMRYDGLNEGIGAGRACWMANKKQGCSCGKSKSKKCHDCEFYKRVVFEQDERVCFKFSSIEA